jgi:hypothetical protein
MWKVRYVLERAELWRLRDEISPAADVDLPAWLYRSGAVSSGEAIRSRTLTLVILSRRVAIFRPILTMAGHDIGSSTIASVLVSLKPPPGREGRREGALQPLDICGQWNIPHIPHLRTPSPGQEWKQCPRPGRFVWFLATLGNESVWCQAMWWRLKR